MRIRIRWCLLRLPRGDVREERQGRLGDGAYDPDSAGWSGLNVVGLKRFLLASDAADRSPQRWAHHHRKTTGGRAITPDLAGACGDVRSGSCTPCSSWTDYWYGLSSARDPRSTGLARREEGEHRLFGRPDFRVNGAAPKYVCVGCSSRGTRRRSIVLAIRRGPRLVQF